MAKTLDMKPLYTQPAQPQQAQVQQPVQPRQVQPTMQTTQKQPVSYIDAAGQKATGIADVPKATPSYYDDMRANYQNMYDEAVRNNNAAAEAAAEQARAAAEAQRQALAQGYQGSNRQLYRDYMNNKRTLPQQMAAAGYSGGLSESARLKLANSYEEALAENARSQLSEQAAADANLANRLYEIQATADSGNQQARQQQLAYEQALLEQQRQERLQQADTLAAAGDFSGYAALGYTQNQIDALARTWLAAHPEMTSSWIAAHPEEAGRLNITAPSTGGGENGYYAPQAASLKDQAIEAAQGGMTLPQIYADLRQQVDSGKISEAEKNEAWLAAVDYMRSVNWQREQTGQRSPDYYVGQRSR